MDHRPCCGSSDGLFSCIAVRLYHICTCFEIDPEAHDTAIKAAVTDAMKRAQRSFGHQFGNSPSGDGTYERNFEEPAAPSQNGRTANGNGPFLIDGKLLKEINRPGALVSGQDEWDKGFYSAAASRHRTRESKPSTR